jgi:glucose/arabinose dehydrogenase
MRRACLALLLLACGGNGEERRAEPTTSPAPRGSEASETAETTETVEAGGSEAPAALPHEIPTEALAPEPIRIPLDELPEPFATESARQSPRVIDPPPDATLRAPAGFRVQRYADGVAHARWLARTPDGRVLCSQARDNRITLLEDADGDGVAERRVRFADASNGLDLPFGMAFADGHFYLGNQDEVRRYPWREGADRLEGTGERITELPGGGYRQHWTRNVVLAPDGEHLFVSVGSRSNASPEPPPRASILRMRLDGSAREVFASGLRNPVGLDFHPRTGALYATVNERDHLGDGLVPDFFTRVEEGAFYGWPYAYLSPDNLDPRRTEDGRSERPQLAARTVTPDVLFEAHSAALGLAFYDGEAFPARYRHGAFVAFRGSWNRSRGTGYEIVHVPFEDGRPVGHYEPFVTGFLVDPSGPVTWGRPVGVLTLPDGSLLFTDEPGGRIYRVSYQAP